MRLPHCGVGEMLWGLGGHAGGGEEDVCGWDDVQCTWDGHGLLDFAHDAVNRGVDAEGLLDDLRVERQFLEGVVGERGQVGAEHGELLFVQLVHDLRAGGEAEQDPGGGRGRRVLPRHEERDHHVRDFDVRHRCTIFVHARHQVPDHVFAVTLAPGGAPRFDDVGVCLRHLALSAVARAVVRKGCP